MPIADRAREIASLLEKWRASFDPSSPDIEEAENQLFRFNLWTSNNFVFESPRASIDWRLRHASVLQSTMEDLLDDLRNSLTGYVFSPTHGAVDLTRKDRATSPEDIEEKLDHLFRFSRAVRRSGILHRFVKLTNYTEYGPDGTNLTEDFRIAASRLVEHYLSGSTASQELQDRLVDTICLRQQNFSYLKARKAKQVIKPIEKIQSSSRPRSTIAPSFSVTGSLASTVKKKNFVPPEHPVMVERSILTATTAQYNDASFNYVAKSAAASGQEIEIISSDSDLPSPPVVPAGRKEWECPYCLLVCSKNEFKGESWKRHILADIMPFVCILDSCPAPSTLFSSSRDWEKHMKYEHDIGSWTCMDTSHDKQFIFGNVSDFKNHMHEYHSGQIDEDDLKDLADACFQSRTMNFSLERCPFCHEDENLELRPGGLIRHVAQHLLEFARISLEGYNEEDNEQSDDYSSVNQIGDSSNQFVSGTITDGLKPDFLQSEDVYWGPLDVSEIAEKPPDTDNTVWELYLETVQKSDENAANDPVLKPFISRLNSNLDSKFQAEPPPRSIVTSLFPEMDIPTRYTMRGKFGRFCEDMYLKFFSRLERRDDNWRRFAPVGTAKQVLQRDVLVRFFRALGFPEAIWIRGRSDLYDDLVRRLDERGLYEFLAILIFGRCDIEAARTFTTEVLGKDPWPKDICSLPANREGLMTLFGAEDTLDRFLANQACFCPVVIHTGTKGHVDSEDLTRLPYLDERLIAHGVFGDVYRVRIAKGHVYDNRMGTRNQQPIVLARKDYVLGKNSLFYSKMNVMEKLRISVRVCENITQTLASLIIGSRIYSIFMPLAICDLRDYMIEYHPSSPSTAAEKANTIFCLKGVAQGLNFLHNELMTSEGERFVCYHLDLKPSNILIFRDEDNKETWKVGGFSMAHMVSRKKEDTKEERRFNPWKNFQRFGSDRELSPERALNRRGEGTYLPPESLASFPSMSTRSDVWSLGSVISVLFAYLEEGASGVNQYSDQRLGHRESEGIDWFFIREKGLKFKAHPGVNRWHHDLVQKATNRNRQEGAIVRSILDFLERSVFVDERNRCDAGTVERELQKTAMLYRQLGSTDTVVFEPTLEERIRNNLGKLPSWLRGRKE